MAERGALWLLSLLWLTSLSTDTAAAAKHVDKGNRVTHGRFVTWTSAVAHLGRTNLKREGGGTLGFEIWAIQSLIRTQTTLKVHKCLLAAPLGATRPPGSVLLSARAECCSWPFSACLPTDPQGSFGGFSPARLRLVAI